VEIHRPLRAYEGGTTRGVTARTRPAARPDVTRTDRSHALRHLAGAEGTKRRGALSHRSRGDWSRKAGLGSDAPGDSAIQCPRTRLAGQPVPLPRPTRCARGVELRRAGTSGPISHMRTAAAQPGKHFMPDRGHWGRSIKARADLGVGFDLASTWGGRVTSPSTKNLRRSRTLRPRAYGQDR